MKANEKTKNTNGTGADQSVQGKAVVYLRPYNYGADVAIEHYAGLTISQQGRACHHAAGWLGMEVVDEIVDRGGPEWNRPGIRQLTESVEAHGADTVICFSQTRLFESLEEIHAFSASLARRGVRVVLSGALNACLKESDA